MKDIYCVHCASQTPHKGYVDANGEFVFDCQTEGCEGFVKFPQVSEASQLEAMIAAHEEVNKPIAESMVSTREQQTILTEVLDDKTEVEVSHEEEEATPVETPQSEE